VSALLIYADKRAEAASKKLDSYEILSHRYTVGSRSGSTPESSPTKVPSYHDLSSTLASNPTTDKTILIRLSNTHHSVPLHPTQHLEKLPDLLRNIGAVTSLTDHV